MTNLKTFVSTGNAESLGNSEPFVASPVATFISKTLADMRTGKRCIEDLRTDRRMSSTKLKAMAKADGLHITMNTLIGDPDVYPTYRSLKFTVEGIVLTKEEVAVQYATLIENIKTFCEQFPEVKASSKLWKSNASGRLLYKQVSSNPHAPFIWRLAGLVQGHDNFDYWSDQDIVQAAVPAGSFTHLKNSDDRLHRHIKGRALEATLACAAPSFANHFYVGHQGVLYRSQPELVAGNYLVLRGIDHSHEVRTGVKRKGSKRSMVADFLIKPANRLLEIAQNLERNRGHRRETYSDRMADKNRRHTEAGLAPIVFDSDPYFVRGVLDVAGMAAALRCELLKHGIDIGEPPLETELIYSDDELKQRVLQAPIDDLWILFKELGIDRVATLQNNFSHILTCLRMRADYKQIMSTMKENSFANRSEKTRQRHALNRELYVPMEVVREFFREFGISSQPQWVAFAKANPRLLKERNIPANPYEVYTKIGSWRSWPYLYPSRKQSKK